MALLDMKRNPSHYSRRLVLFVLVPLLIADLSFGLPDGAFLAGAGIVMVAAAGIHFHGDERRASAGWLVFGVALGILAVTDPTANPLYLGVFAVLLFAGLLFLVSQTRADSE